MIITPRPITYDQCWEEGYNNALDDQAEQRLSDESREWDRPSPWE